MIKLSREKRKKVNHQHFCQQKYFETAKIWVGRTMACSRRLDCGKQRKAARSARVGAREDWERSEETHVKLILESSCRPLLTADSGQETCSLHDRRFMSQAGRTRYFARSARRGKEKNKALFFSTSRLALRARVHPAWLIKRLSCRLRNMNPLFAGLWFSAVYQNRCRL